ncbi:MAG TPA: polysaccharide deacetylase family protein [Rhizobiaceae bacterium]|nr:polysaccharide deacetylase family protein [Rhizobiaceae bacterium]
MRSSVLAALGFATLLGACAQRPDVSHTVPVMSFAAETPAPPLLRFGSGNAFAHPGGLAGRILTVGSVADLKLAQKEVVLTFDDGPVAGKTRAILDALDKEGVKATFLMVGQMAQAHPALVREVAARGHSIGTHTQNHANLATVGFERATQEIDNGRRSVAAALVPMGTRAAPFFRFPYLADTAALRRHLAMQGIVVVDPTVDSKDYFVSTPEQVRKRTIAALEAKGSGIVLFHDLHQRTVAMLPSFLDDLKARGFKVVHLAPRGNSSNPLLSAALDW